MEAAFRAIEAVTADNVIDHVEYICEASQNLLKQVQPQLHNSSDAISSNSIEHTSIQRSPITTSVISNTPTTSTRADYLHATYHQISSPAASSSVMSNTYANSRTTAGKPRPLSGDYANSMSRGTSGSYTTDNTNKYSLEQPGRELTFEERLGNTSMSPYSAPSSQPRFGRGGKMSSPHSANDLSRYQQQHQSFHREMSPGGRYPVRNVSNQDLYTHGTRTSYTLPSTYPLSRSRNKSMNDTFAEHLRGTESQPSIFGMTTHQSSNSLRSTEAQYTIGEDSPPYRQQPFSSHDSFGSELTHGLRLSRHSQVSTHFEAAPVDPFRGAGQIRRSASEGYPFTKTNSNSNASIHTAGHMSMSGSGSVHIDVSDIIHDMQAGGALYPYPSSPPFTSPGSYSGAPQQASYTAQVSALSALPLSPYSPFRPLAPSQSNGGFSSLSNLPTGSAPSLASYSDSSFYQPLSMTGSGADAGVGDGTVSGVGREGEADEGEDDGQYDHYLDLNMERALDFIDFPPSPRA